MITPDDVRALADEIGGELRSLRAQISALEADADAMTVAIERATVERDDAIAILRNLIRGECPIDVAAAWLNSRDTRKGDVCDG